jgi:hypothetical protein
MALDGFWMVYGDKTNPGPVIFDEEMGMGQNWVPQ